MTIKYSDGFDFVRDDTDLTVRNWTRSTAAATTNGVGVLGIPAKTGFSGCGLKLRGPYAAGTTLPMGTAGATDFGMLNTGLSVNSLWNAGGFSLAANVTFNGGTQVQVGAAQVCAFCYDGAQYYWAILQTGASTFTVGYSTDLINWTTTVTQPTGIVQASSIYVSGSGPNATVIIGRGPFNLTANVGLFYYTQNLGITWTATTTSVSGVRTIVATGNATTPYLFTAWDGTTFVTLYTMTSISSAATRVGTIQISPSGATTQAAVMKRVGNLIMACGWAQYGQAGPDAHTSWWTGISNTADMTNAANYVTSASITNAIQNDITFFNNTWLSVGYGGLYGAPNPATAPAVSPPTAAWSTLINAGTSTIFSIDCNSTICVAVGQDPVTPTKGAIWTSTDGVTWTKQNRFVLSASATTGSQGFVNVKWTGTQFVLVGALNSNVIATSTDGLNWNPIYYPDYTETTQGNSAFGFFSGTINTSTGVFTPWGTTSTTLAGLALAVGALSSGNRTLAGGVCNGDGSFATSTTPQVVTSMSTTTHAIELIATAAATVNQFTFQLSIDGIVQGTNIALGSTVAALSSTGDTTGTNLLMLNLPRSGQIVQIDDCIIASKNGSFNVAPLGQTYIVPRTLNTDVQDQFTPSSGTSNVAVASSNALSNATGYVSTSTDGSKDIYGSSINLPGNVKVFAVIAEAVVTKISSTNPTVNVGVRSGSSETDGANVIATSSTQGTIATAIAETDPATGVAWTLSGANAAGVAVNKVS